MLYLDMEKLITDIKSFLIKHQTFISNNSQKISILFQISAYNDVVEYYKRRNFVIKPKNLINGEFRYKQTPTGHPHNFSYFSILKSYKKQNYEFYIYNNIAVESGISKGIFVCPDIVIANVDSICYLYDKEYYFNGLKKYAYIENKNLQSFCEVKHYTPFPELLISFIGLLQELTNDIYKNKRNNTQLKHLAPSLILSGEHTRPTRQMAQILEKRYRINIFDGLFVKRSKIKSIQYHHATVGTK